MNENFISGYENEIEFVHFLNHKRINKLNPMFEDLIYSLFTDLKGDEEIVAWKNKFLEKTDIFIKIGNQTRGISLKKGIKNSVHASRISDFIRFLIENDIEREVVMEFLKFQYADGTTNNKGAKRLSTLEYKELHQDKIDLMNVVFNDEKFLVKAIEFFVLKGKMAKISIDALIYGTINDFIWIKKDDIVSILLSKRKNYASGVHFSNLLCQPMSRNLNNNPKYENCRYIVQIKWYSLFDDIIENMNNKCLEKLDKNIV